MTMPTWPVDLPPPLANGYKETRQNNTLRSEMAAGPAKVRLKSTWASSLLDVSWVLTDQQFDRFIEFYDVTLVYGVKAFRGFPRPRTGLDTTITPVRFITTNGGLALSYSDEYQAWQITAQLETLPQSYASD